MRGVCHPWIQINSFYTVFVLQKRLNILKKNFKVLLGFSLNTITID